MTKISSVNARSAVLEWGRPPSQNGISTAFPHVGGDSQRKEGIVLVLQFPTTLNVGRGSGGRDVR